MLMRFWSKISKMFLFYVFVDYFKAKHVYSIKARMCFDHEFLVEHAVSSLPQDVGKYALYMLYHNNIEIY